ncbi:hypothetical protein L21SP5_00622 [Salinivirga cyanobacteriivorans]|uniref:SiaC family regulatory phosphoprotein domain-containing protein n=1 Tax=Salinivirga cyanobacteriivorans TaxID=1307839 RepID=A0A0S2HWA4_9BACT|nr:DUF1987 domain-containing protein [Salinivirga cyanobacteriivorans]ALO14294.1 hypothetical protein L21SP5_00622 [Salinivirga cyanobacteriivorans]
MKPLTIKATRQSPEIYLDAEDGIMKFTGKSRPEDALLFYEPVITWIKQYANNPQPQTKVVFNLEYFNSSTTKVFKSFFECLCQIKEQAKALIIEWHYHEDDEDMQDVGEELASLYGLPFTFIAYNS